MTYSFATPGDQYLIKIGTMAYAVSTMEWMALGDLSRHNDELPRICTLESLAGKTTGAIGQTLTRAAAMDGISARLSSFLETAGRILKDAAEIRNAVLHARPATIDGTQRLYRWKADIAPFIIDDTWLDGKLQELETLSRELSRARVI